MAIHRTFNKRDTDKVAKLGQRNAPTTIIDPGAEGVALFWDDGFARWPRPPDLRRSIGSNGSGHRQVAHACRELGVKTVIIEDQYIGKGVKAGISLIRSGGMVVGHIQMHAPPDEVVWIPPWAWQKRLQPGPDAKTRSEVHACRLLGRGWLARQGPSPLQQACADVVGMGAFYEEITRHAQSTDDDVGF